MGDLGTYIPRVLALTLAKELNLGTTLIFTGVYNIVAGAIYGVPMPVQPMRPSPPWPSPAGRTSASLRSWPPGFGPAASSSFSASPGSCSSSTRSSRRDEITQSNNNNNNNANINDQEVDQEDDGEIRLPLSVLNSLVAVCELSSDLFPGKELSATSLSVTVRLMRVLVRGHAVLPRRRGNGGAVKVRRQERRLRGAPRRGEAGAGAGFRDVFRHGVEAVPGGGSALVCRD
ncbi:hypothetical protein L484_014929 [Morus notabilis]|uniref:Uncharacterized protein n=1 Tax=Morus notabilis TaxID=981085 RepID=W9R9S4_9ROSA|nr:hypothetical protein L484_014929 [Morus notabilis]